MTLEELLGTPDVEQQAVRVAELITQAQNFSVAVNIINGQVSVQPIGTNVPIELCRDALIKGLTYLQEVENAHRRNDLQQSPG